MRMPVVPIQQLVFIVVKWYCIYMSKEFISGTRKTFMCFGNTPLAKHKFDRNAINTNNIPLYTIQDLFFIGKIFWSTCEFPVKKVGNIATKFSRAEYFITGLELNKVQCP